jgi:hypothetical protein
LPQSAFISNMILCASIANTGNGIESTEGGSVIFGDVGLDDWRFMSLRPDDFFSFSRGGTGGAANSGIRLVAMFGKSMASNDAGEGLWSSVKAWEPAELMLLTRCLFSSPGGALRCASIDISNVLVRGRTPLFPWCVLCGRFGGLPSSLSYGSTYESLKTMPCRLLEPPGIDLGELS